MICCYQAYHIIRQLVKGFQEHGLQENDVVCCHMYNNVSQVFTERVPFSRNRASILPIDEHNVRLNSKKLLSDKNINRSGIR